MGGREVDLHGQLVALDQPVAVDAHRGAHVGVGGSEQAEAEQQQEWSAERGKLRPPADKGGDQRDAAEDRVGGELRRGGAVHRSSAGGVGTVARRSATTSSARTCWTQSSGRSESRWARAGAATALTSSGTTKSRPSRAARARASFMIASVPRGLAPTWTLGASRVARTTSTM